jgi:hypothetical protein
MKKMFIAAIIMAATTVTVSANEVISPDTVKVDSLIIVNNDQELFDQLREADKAFEEKSNASMPYQDVTLSYVGNDGTPHPLSKRIQGGWFLSAGGGLIGTQGYTSPALFIGGGYQANKWSCWLDLYGLAVKPNKMSDYQGRIKALRASIGLSRSFFQALDGHLKLSGEIELAFQTTLDRQNFDEYSYTYEYDTEEYHVEGQRSGNASYEVKPFMIGGGLGLRLDYQFYNSPIGLFVKGGYQCNTEIAGKETIEDQNRDGIHFNHGGEVEVGVRLYLHKKAKNVKSKNIIKHNGSAAYYAY